MTIVPPDEGLFQEYTNLGEISSFMAGNSRLYDIPASFAILTPTSGADITLPSARVGLGESSGESGRYKLEVMPLPPEVVSTGAVGSFSMTTEIDRTELHHLDEAVFRLRIEGAGNLNYLNMPAPEFIGAELMSTYGQEDFKPSLEGYEGYRETVYTIKAVDTRKLKNCNSSLSLCGETFRCDKTFQRKNFQL